MINIGRKPRIWYPHAEYHIMNRGNHRNNIFRDDEDYQIFLKITENAQKRYPYLLVSYCLMTNHFHLQIKTIDHEIWHIMRYISFIYSKYFNKKYNIIGHLFQGRYTSELIEDDGYRLYTSRYIHLNPVKAKMVDRPIEYPWSSYRVFMGEEEGLVDSTIILNYFLGKSSALYQDYVEGSFKGKISEDIIKFESEVDIWHQ